MKRFSPIAIVLSLLLAANAAFATGSPYGWTVSASLTNPYQNTDAFIPGLKTLYVWFACSTPEPEGPGGMAAAQFAVCGPTANLILAVIPKNTFLNAGPAPAGNVANLLLAVGGCPAGPMIAANILVLNNVPGQWCICPFDDVKGTVDCSPNPLLWSMDWIGLDEGTGAEPCGKGNARCDKPVSVESESWGRIKGMYR